VLPVSASLGPLAGLDPADMLELRGPSQLREALVDARPLAEVLVEERLMNLSPAQAIPEAAQVVAARPSARWATDSDRISPRLQASMATVRRDLNKAVTEWNRDSGTGHSWMSPLAPAVPERRSAAILSAHACR
jgi:hypothetical protein